ncbi:hypothetical protein BJ973_009383 [Actinoplanes tereljensis]|uniref:Lipoprotein n=1 Tax=Paractinoplanes tereljensis TaxID=571912 RepID=A0A919NH08_9ACTN|nr:hypothetical protein [Actinoplanes tereljensis]GIF17652.1 hypothetical protein Ate02nite_03820 [Actinoplanes tereljensis]
MRALHMFGLAAGAVVVLGGCSKAEPAKTAAAAPVAPASASADAPPACKDVFQPGKLVDKEKAKAGCASPSGTALMLASLDCKDGTQLWQVGAASGAPAGYVRDGQPYQVVKADATTDANYMKAYKACTG